MKATEEQVQQLAQTVLSQAAACAEMIFVKPGSREYHAKVLLLADNVDTLKAWTVPEED